MPSCAVLCSSAPLCSTALSFQGYLWTCLSVGEALGDVPATWIHWQCHKTPGVLPVPLTLSMLSRSSKHTI